MEAIQKFQNLLKELFQFEASDLDFGIYRILNYKRSQIERFIEQDLVNRVEAAFSRHTEERLASINQRFEQVKEEVTRTLGPDAITPTGELKKEYQNTPVGRKFLDIKAQRDEAKATDEIKIQVFNDLYSFFSRYYEEGDFAPHYRYSIRGHRYAIPYNGEEVKLYWANSDQYYIKTGELFRDYTFKTADISVIFRVIEAKTELGSNKATKQRFFILDDENPVELADDNRTLIIRFQYRELSDEEVRHYGVGSGSNTAKQEKVNLKSYEAITGRLSNVRLRAKLAEPKNDKPLLLYHLNRFTARNTQDYFIHKNLKRFLSEQLDYFIKSEVLDIETIAQERFLDKHLIRAKLVRELGEAIIDFLAQIEDFQKRLWEKKKFVLKTEYVITTDRIPEEFYPEIWKNKEQKKEWQELGFDIPETATELKDHKLPVDTRYFPAEFKERLLERLSEGQDLDDLLDGILIKSENWQALNLLLEKYRERVQTIYIDPPFNKEQDADYLYNVKYKDSTWASMLENRLRLAWDLLNEKGSIFVRCDYNGNWILRPLMNEIFGPENFRNEIIIAKSKEFFKTMTHINKFSEETESMFLFSKTDNMKFNLIYRKKEKPSVYEPFLPVEDKNYKDYREINGEKYYSPKGRKWGIKQEDIKKFLHSKRLIFENGKWYLVTYEEPLKNHWLDYQGYSRDWNFKTENSEILIKRSLGSTSDEDDLVMDFFLGSGTTTAVAHKLGRKWIGVEMGEHFWTVVLPRMKKVLAYDSSGISKEKDVKERYNSKTAGGFFKYQILEQYEDSLDNIELKENRHAEMRFKDEYLLKYFLDFETRESPYLLNLSALKKPFDYKLKVNLSEVGEPQEMVIDIPETFNYLLGLKVKKIKVRNNGRKYLFILAQKEGRDYAIVWRDYSDKWTEKDFQQDKEFINQELSDWQPQIVYLNGQSVLTPKNWEVRYIEPEFKRLMS